MYRHVPGIPDWGPRSPLQWVDESCYGTPYVRPSGACLHCTIQRILDCLYPNAPDLVEDLFSWRWGVAPSCWPDGALAGWGDLVDPPTPYEVASGRRYTRLHSLGACESSFFYLWLKGMSLDVLDHYWQLGTAGQEHIYRSAIQELMSSPSFRLWAIGEDFSSFVTPLAARKALGLRFAGAPAVSTDTRWIDQYADHPLVRARLLGAPPFTPVPRTLARHPRVARTREEKRSWLRGNDVARAHFLSGRRTFGANDAY